MKLTVKRWNIKWNINCPILLYQHYKNTKKWITIKEETNVNRSCWIWVKYGKQGWEYSKDKCNPSMINTRELSLVQDKTFHYPE